MTLPTGLRPLPPARPRGYSAFFGTPDSGRLGRVCRLTVPEMVTPYMRLDRLCAEIENVPTGGSSYRKAVERLRTLPMRRVDEGDAVEILCARLVARGVVVRESLLAAFVETGRFPGRIPSRERLLALTPEDLRGPGTDRRDG